MAGGIANFQCLYNGINQILAYPPIAIHSPEEVIANEDYDL